MPIESQTRTTINARFKGICSWKYERFIKIDKIKMTAITLLTMQTPKINICKVLKGRNRAEIIKKQ